MAGPRDDNTEIHRATDVRQGEIILRSKRRRAIFVAGFVAAVVVAGVLAFSVTP